MGITVGSLTVDVAGTSSRICPVLDAVVLDADPPVIPAHVDATHEIYDMVEYFDLCSLWS